MASSKWHRDFRKGVAYRPDGRAEVTWDPAANTDFERDIAAADIATPPEGWVHDADTGIWIGLGWWRVEPGYQDGWVVRAGDSAPGRRVFTTADRARGHCELRFDRTGKGLRGPVGGSSELTETISSVRCTPDEKQWAETMAKEAGVPVTRLMRDLVRAAWADRAQLKEAVNRIANMPVAPDAA